MKEESLGHTLKDTVLKRRGKKKKTPSSREANICAVPRFIIVFTSVHHFSLPSARSIQYMPSHLISVRCILILSSHLRVSFTGTFLPVSAPKILCAFLFSLVQTPCAAHLIFLDKTVPITKLLIV